VVVVTEVKRGAGVAMFVVLLVAIGGLGYGVATASGRLDRHPSATPASASASPQPAPRAEPQQILPAAQPLAPVPALLGPGDHGPRVRALQARLRQLAWYAGDVTDAYGKKTSAAVRGFQAKRGLPRLGYVDAETMKRLKTMTHAPTYAELTNKPTDGSWTDAPLDPRCRTGRVLCIDKTSRTVRWVVDGDVEKTMAVRFGASYTPTREGVFAIQRKSRDHVSTLFHSAMPFAMFFSGGQAVHYSSDFAARGYAGASHGCVNVRDYDGVKWLFDQVRVGDEVVIYWS
jgi:peptidoglycan hydrolase-like protein with peptidoglycan-binding domain